MEGDIRMKTIRESRFLQASLPIQFTGIFQAYIEIIYKDEPGEVLCENISIETQDNMNFKVLKVIFVSSQK